MDAQNKQRACFFLPRREYDIVIPGYSVPPPPHGHVLRDIKTILEQAGIGALKFVGTYLDSQNKQRPCYFLPKLECILIMSGYSPTYLLPERECMLIISGSFWGRLDTMK